MSEGFGVERALRSSDEAGGDGSAARLPPWPVVAGGCLVTAAAAAGAPLLVYTFTLAAFGLVHVLSELRYVDARFGPRLGRGLRWWLGSLLGGVVLVRALDLAGALPGSRAPLELILVGALAAAALPSLVRSGAGRASLGVAAVAGVGYGVVAAPAATLLLLAALHNLTPIGFLAERLRGVTRRRVLIFCGVAFGAVPAAIAAGAPRALLARAGVFAPDWTVFAAGGLDAHLGAYLPPGWWNAPSAPDLFAAAVYLQCLHYAVVIHVLPRLADPDSADEPSLLPWPSRQRFVLLLAAAAVATLVAFAASFFTARRVYGLAAAVHAWVELPLLLLALASPGLASPAGSDHHDASLAVPTTPEGSPS